jgi:hypothetical protein
MFRKFTKIRMISLILLIVVMTGILITGIRFNGGSNWVSKGGNNPSWAYKNKIVREENLDGIEKINFKMDVSEIILKTTDDNKIKVIERSDKKLKNDRILNISKQGNELSFVEPKKRFTGFGIFWSTDKKVVEIFLPKEYKEKFKLQSDVGDLYVKSDLDLNEITLESDVGKILVERAINTKKLVVTSDVGDIKLNRAEADNYKIKSDVGKVVLERILGKGSIQSEVGDVICNLERIDGDIDVSTDVGKIVINIDKSQKFMLDAKSDVGKVISNVDKNIFGDSGKTIKVRSDVGKIKLNFLGEE